MKLLINNYSPILSILQHKKGKTVNFKAYLHVAQMSVMCHHCNCLNQVWYWKKKRNKEKKKETKKGKRETNKQISIHVNFLHYTSKVVLKHYNTTETSPYCVCTLLFCFVHAVLRMVSNSPIILIITASVTVEIGSRTLLSLIQKTDSTILFWEWCGTHLPLYISVDHIIQTNTLPYKLNRQGGFETSQHNWNLILLCLHSIILSCPFYSENGVVFIYYPYHNYLKTTNKTYS